MTSIQHSQPGPDPPELSRRLALSVDEAAALLGVSRDLVYDLVASGEIPSLRLGRRIVVPRHALEQVINSAIRPTTDER